MTSLECFFLLLIYKKTKILLKFFYLILSNFKLIFENFFELDIKLKKTCCSCQSFFLIKSSKINSELSAENAFVEKPKKSFLHFEIS